MNQYPLTRSTLEYPILETVAQNPLDAGVPAQPLVLGRPKSAPEAVVRPAVGAVRQMAKRRSVTDLQRLLVGVALAAALMTLSQSGFAQSAGIFDKIGTEATGIKTSAIKAIPLVGAALAAFFILMYLFGDSRAKQGFLKAAIVVGAAGAIIGLVGG